MPFGYLVFIRGASTGLRDFLKLARFMRTLSQMLRLNAILGSRATIYVVSVRDYITSLRRSASSKARNLQVISQFVQNSTQFRTQGKAVPFAIFIDLCGAFSG